MSESEIGVILERIKGLNDVLARFERNNQADHNELKEHAKTTNGRVNKLEDWRNRIVGGIVVLNILLVPVVIYVVIDFLDK